MLKCWQNYRQLQRRQQIVIAAVFGVIIAIILAVSSFASYRYFQNKTNKTTNNSNAPINLDLPLVLDTSQIDEDDKTELNVLLIGYGGAGHQGGMLSDVIQVAHLDFEKEIISFIAIPRDLEIQLSNGQNKKINSVFSYGMTGEKAMQDAGQLTKQVLSTVTGLNIKYFIAVDFVGFQRLIGQELGGLEVQVSQALDDPWYPIEGKQLEPCGHTPEEIAQLTNTMSGFALESQFECRYEHLSFKPGLQVMEGGDALKYVRSRHSSSDFDRSRRQVEVLTAIRQKLFKLNALAKIPDYFKAVSRHVSSDFDLASLEYLAPLLINTQNFEVKSISLNTDNVLSSAKNQNGSVLIPKAGQNNWQGMQTYILSQLTASE